jgi:signal transduction histidine kinase
MWWVLGATANLVIALAYFGIFLAILVPLVRTRQVPSNRLGTATAAIFLTGTVHHGFHLREAFDWHQAVWDSLGAVVGLWYWSLRSTYGSLMRGASLFQDLKEKQRQALEINDNIVQGLAVAKMSLELGERERSAEAMERALAAARQIITDLLGEAGSETRLGPGDLQRRVPAHVAES